ICGVAAAEDRIVSTAAAIPKRVWCEGRILAAYELGDFLTAEAFRNRGLVGKLIDMVAAEAQRRGPAMVYVQPNRSPFPILLRRGFVEVKKIQQRRFPVASQILAKRSGVSAAVWRSLGIDKVSAAVGLRGRHDAAVTVEQIARFDGETDALWESARPG